MKKVFTIVATFFFMAGFSQENKSSIVGMNENQIEKYNKATVEQYTGEDGRSLLIFLNSNPIEKFKVLGSKKMPSFDTRNGRLQLNTLFYKVIKDHPTAQGILINTKEDRWEAIAIVFE